MTPVMVAALALVIGGLLVYVPTSGRFMQDYLGRYGAAPSRRCWCNLERSSVAT